MKFKCNFFYFLNFFLIFSCFSLNANVNQSSALSAFVEGCTAFSDGEWDTAVIALRRAISYKENQTPETYYMLSSAENSFGDYESSLETCEFYLKEFPDSFYEKNVEFLKGKVLFNLGEYEKSYNHLQEFSEKYSDDLLYPSALFYIAESCYASYEYDKAEDIYKKIINEYPDCEKASAASYRLESIGQRTREEKLLYLLKQTGEEYLSAKEEYERQLRLSNSDSVSSTREKLNEALQKNRELEEQIRELENQLSNSNLNQTENSNESQNQSEKSEISENPEELANDEYKSAGILTLKLKALQVQKILNEKSK